jgi:hypothetical protein
VKRQIREFVRNRHKIGHGTLEIETEDDRCDLGEIDRTPRGMKW